MSDKELENKWQEFANVSINNNDELEDDWWIFEKGTDKYDVWDYFDTHHSKGVKCLSTLFSY